MSEDNSTSKINLKYYFMSTAEVVDAFRGIPRLIVAAYCYLVWVTVNWFMALPEPTSQHTFLISTIVGGAAAVFGLYVNSGSGWDRKTARKDAYMEYTNTTSYNPRREHSARAHRPRRNRPNYQSPHSRPHNYSSPQEASSHSDFDEDGAVSADAFVFETSPPDTNQPTDFGDFDETPPSEFIQAMARR